MLIQTNKYPPITLLGLFLVGSTMTSDAFMVSRSSTQYLNASLRQQIGSEEQTISIPIEIMTRADADEKPSVQIALKTSASVATGTLLAMSLFFSPIQTSDSEATVPFLTAQPALAAKTMEAVSNVSPQELQLKSAKSTMTEATQSLKGVESRIKSLEGSLKKKEQSISASEKSIKKFKKALQQAEKSYRGLEKQKKPAKVLDKEKQKVGTSPHSDLFRLTTLFSQSQACVPRSY